MIADNLIKDNIPFAILEYKKTFLIDKSITNLAYSIAISSDDAERAKDARFAKGLKEDNEADDIAMLELTSPEEQELRKLIANNRKVKLVKTNKNGRVWEFAGFRAYIKNKRKAEME